MKYVPPVPSMAKAGTSPKVWVEVRIRVSISQYIEYESLEVAESLQENELSGQAGLDSAEARVRV